MSWLVQLAPNPPRPMRRDHQRPAQLTPGLAKEGIINRVMSTLSGVETLFQKENELVREKTNVDINLLGEVQNQGDASEDTASIGTYWAWTTEVCRRTKEPRRTVTSDPPPDRRSRSRSRSRSRLSSASRSHRSPKRSKYSSRSQSRDKSRSPRHRRSPSPSGHHQRTSSRGRPRTSSYSRSRSPAPPRGRSVRRRSFTNSISRPSSRDSSRSRSRPPRHRPSPPPALHSDSDHRAARQPPNPHPHHGFPVMPARGPGCFSVPPPPPPAGYQGIFPPLPIPPQGWIPNQPGIVPPPMMGGGWGAGPVPPLQPPLQPSPYDGQQQQYGGRGMAWPGGGGREHRGRGRGGNGRGGYGYGGYRGYGGYGAR